MLVMHSDGEKSHCFTTYVSPRHSCVSRCHMFADPVLRNTRIVLCVLLQLDTTFQYWAALKSLGNKKKNKKPPGRLQRTEQQPIEFTLRPCREPIKRRSLLSRSRDPVTGTSLWLVFSQSPDGLWRRKKTKKQTPRQTLIFVTFSP